MAKFLRSIFGLDALRFPRSNVVVRFLGAPCVGVFWGGSGGNLPSFLHLLVGIDLGLDSIFVVLQSELLLHASAAVWRVADEDGFAEGA